MKSFYCYSLLSITILTLFSFKPKHFADDSYFAIIVVDGIWKEKVGYASRIIYYPGYTNCNKNRNLDFFADAKRSFSSFLKTNYKAAFPYGENNNFQIIDKMKNSTSTLLKTRAQAEQRLSEWIAEQKAKEYSVQHTSFGYNCNK